jgi:uncharacterized protein (DUF1684 family)
MLQKWLGYHSRRGFPRVGDDTRPQAVAHHRRDGRTTIGRFDVRHLLSCSLVLALFSLGCAAPEPGDTAGAASGTPEAEDGDVLWATELAAHRAEIHDKFLSYGPSPIAGTQRLSAESPTGPVYLTREDRTFAFADAPGPAAAMSLAKEGSGWTWEKRGDDVSCTAGEEPAESGSTVSGDVSFDVSGIHLGCYLGADWIACIVYDPERPEKKAFEHLVYYPPDRSYAVPARLVRIAEPDEIEMLTSLGRKSTFLRYARIHFELEGQEQALTAYKSTYAGEWSDSLFVPFRDTTSGQVTYGAGRYLDLPEPEGETLTLDFNRAYNPLCNYSPAFNCPIPPRENRLRVAIRAGEKTYPH